MDKYRNGGVIIGLLNVRYKKTDKQYGIPKPTILFSTVWLWKMQ
jgi:hypothetical protein